MPATLGRKGCVTLGRKGSGQDVRFQLESLQEEGLGRLLAGELNKLLGR